MGSRTGRYLPGTTFGCETLPADCPIERSTGLAGIAFTGRHASYTNADTWYPSWAADGAMYTPFTDGQAGHIAANSTGGGVANTGYARIEGDDPMALTVVPLGTEMASARPYCGRYPSACLMHRGVWYCGTYCLDKSAPEKNWDILGPFVGFHLSRDGGRTWEHGPHCPARPLFGESGKHGGKVKIGSPHFVDFGQELRHSPDGLAYLVAHGGTRPEANLSWISGDEVYVLRVDPSEATINDAAAYEFFAGRTEDGTPSWSRELAAAQPIVAWSDHLGCVTITYVPGLRRYLMCTSHGWPTTGTMTTLMLEAERLEGPWRLFAHLPDFGTQAYFVNIPSRFVAEDGGSLWLCYSANFSNAFYDLPQVAEDPPGSRYAMCLHELTIIR